MSDNEYLTRKKKIDPKLRAAGWDVVPYTHGKPLSAYERCAIEEYPTDNGPADYALCINGDIFGIVEAKKVTLGPQNVLPQAERYARGLKDNQFNFDGLRAPFLYSTNGEVIWYHDVRHRLNRSRQVAGFHSPDALLDRLQADIDSECVLFFSTPDNGRMRPYQRDAGNAIGEAITGRHRAMRVAMATGTGALLQRRRCAHSLRLRQNRD
jgi:type I restriction enzyme R subunit